MPGDLGDRDSLDVATKGIQAAFIASRDHPDQVQWETNLIASLEARAPVQLVKVSAFAASLDPPPGYGRNHAAIEARLRESRLPWTVLQPYMYMQNFLEMANAVRYARAYCLCPWGTAAWPSSTHATSPARPRACWASPGTPPRPTC